jgi:hypothetical protein
MSYRAAKQRYVDARVAEHERAVTAASGRDEKMAMIPVGRELRYEFYGPVVIAWALLMALFGLGVAAAFTFLAAGIFWWLSVGW